ncbi:hypothetical protein Glove_228g52 [Diversispora epigaea]|uniref:Serine-threonine/tyrosine-protein kinase catalytic domain-containing protein n=1 Tax=Diversispora epigaea TaxID=1348612 RepID=A0A397IDB0_9GLOM|nr:hypothetical protein Glove_228g52 [Diversispora epigaea]
MLNLIPKHYLDLMYRCWDDDPFKRPTVLELVINADFNRIIMNKSHQHKLLRSLHNLHPQSCYIVRPIYTLYGFQDSLEDIKFGKCADINIIIFNLI